MNKDTLVNNRTKRLKEYIQSFHSKEEIFKWKVTFEIDNWNIWLEFDQLKLRLRSIKKNQILRAKSDKCVFVYILLWEVVETGGIFCYADLHACKLLGKYNFQVNKVEDIYMCHLHITSFFYTNVSCMLCFQLLSKSP